jgi:agmatinase
MMNLQKLSPKQPPGTVVVVGVPSDENSSFTRGPASAPSRIREALTGGSSNMFSENETDLDAEPRFVDIGDLQLKGGKAAFQQIEETITELLQRGVRILSLGGDHAITYPILRAYGNTYKRLNILHLDAHPDLYEAFGGNPFSNACPFARIMEEKLAARLVQIGIRTMNPHQRMQADKYGVEVTKMAEWSPDLVLDFKGPVYLSLDMDVLDPAFAPGVSHHEPGGLSTRDAIRLIQGLRAPLVGADIVEFNPKRDPAGITAMAAAKLLKEIAARMLEDTNCVFSSDGSAGGQPNQQT